MDSVFGTAPLPDPFEDVNEKISLLMTISRSMRMTINDFVDKKHYSGGTCDEMAGKVLRCALNKADEHLKYLKEQF